jgi:hypothetical protein
MRAGDWKAREGRRKRRHYVGDGLSRVKKRFMMVDGSDRTLI